MSIDLTGRDFLKELDFSKDELSYLLELSSELKAAHRSGAEVQRLRARASPSSSRSPRPAPGARSRWAPTSRVPM